MNLVHYSDKLNAVIPGVVDRYRELKSTDGQGIYTSLGRYYNHTIFGRDAGMTAKFVSNFDHDVAWQTIVTLALHQGISHDVTTQESPGRIHHELRDYAAWQGRWYDRVGLVLAGKAWGMQNRKITTYFAADTTATYIRLVHKYASRIDRSILERSVPRRDGVTVPLNESVAAAADWITGEVDNHGIFMTRRSNRWSLPYQTFADSISAYADQDRKPMPSSQPHSFIEAQGYAIDALQDAARLLPSHTRAAAWQQCAEQMHNALFRYFWSDTRHTFAPAVWSKDEKLIQLDTEMISAAWILNASFWEFMPDLEHKARIITLVRGIFHDDFLTNYGIRTKSLKYPEPLNDIIDYHGSQTVWPMFNFMVIEGLRRHKLYRLARQLENRLINSLNALGDFPEFFIVDKNGVLYKPDKKAPLKKSSQMIPEHDIAFTVVPALTLAYRHLYRRSSVVKEGWQRELEDAILRDIPLVELLSPEEARYTIQPTPLRLKRTWAGLRSAALIAPVILKKPL